MSEANAPLLVVNNIEVIYDHVTLEHKGESLHEPEGRIVALLGANGAGKTTALKAISGVLRTERGEVTKGTIELAGERIDRLPAFQVVARGHRVGGHGRTHLLAERHDRCQRRCVALRLPPASPRPRTTTTAC